ncbi:MAG: class I SAM-dependent methyltransferase [Candidatus Kariarchaeaceae archaeon]|jgi:ubiquinone/menaquinone biosynthesis C-methylase UbiE
MTDPLRTLLNTTEYIQCCTNFYEDDLVSFLLGDSLHPGGLQLTRELGRMLKLTEDFKVLDLACGKGNSAIILAQEFGCSVVGVDLSIKNIKSATQTAKELGLSKQVEFHIADVQLLPFSDQFFDAVIIECSFCIFPDKQAVMNETYRVLKNNGFIGISDISIEKTLPYEIEAMVYRVACIADARSTKEYQHYLEQSSFVVTEVEDKKTVLIDLHSSLKKKLFLLHVAKNMKKKELRNIDLGNLDFSQLNKYLDRIKEFVEDGYGSYVLIMAQKTMEL